MKSFLNDNNCDFLWLKHGGMSEKRYADRIKTILFLDSGDSYSEVAARLRLDDDMVRPYHEQYEKNGIEDLLKDDYTCKSSYLNEEQLIGSD